MIKRLLDHHRRRSRIHHNANGLGLFDVGLRSEGCGGAHGILAIRDLLPLIICAVPYISVDAGSLRGGCVALFEGLVGIEYLDSHIAGIGELILASRAIAL